MKTAIIIGHTGQDGTYLWQLLTKKKYSIIGISSNQINVLGFNKIPNASPDLTFRNISAIINYSCPDEIYYLAAVHHSSSDVKMNDMELFGKSFEVNVMGLVNCLEAVKQFSPSTKLFYAASSHIFGNPSSLK